jgi:hypothetical protein
MRSPGVSLGIDDHLVDAIAELMDVMTGAPGIAIDRALALEGETGRQGCFVAN